MIENLKEWAISIPFLFNWLYLENLASIKVSILTKPGGLNVETNQDRDQERP